VPVSEKAFPQIEGWKEADVSEIKSVGGMDLRDYFAAKAMAAAITVAPGSGASAGAPDPEMIASYAYRVANAMMAHRALNP
jgi:hypothetical protein